MSDPPGSPTRRIDFPPSEKMQCKDKLGSFDLPLDCLNILSTIGVPAQPCVYFRGKESSATCIMTIKNRKRKLRGHTTEELWTINELKSSRLYHDHRGGSVDGRSDGCRSTRHGGSRTFSLRRSSPVILFPVTVYW